MKAVILIFYVTDYKIQLPYGRALKPRPYNRKHQVFSIAAAMRET